MGTIKNALPSGGKKGGAIFPRYALETSVAAAKRLVSKTHVGPVPKDIYFSGVLQASGPRAEVKASALKQFGFVHGTTQTGLTATTLAKTIINADEPQRTKALRTAALSPKIFKGIFDAFHGDTIGRSKLKQRASELNVHPDMLDTCVKVYVESLGFAGLVSVNGDQVTHVSAADQQPVTDSMREDSPAVVGTEEQGDDLSTSSSEKQAEVDLPPALPRTTRATINVTINLDSSLDTEKLARQLALLKKFGAI